MSQEQYTLVTFLSKAICDNFLSLGTQSRKFLEKMKFSDEKPLNLEERAQTKLNSKEASFQTLKAQLEVEPYYFNSNQHKSQ